MRATEAGLLALLIGMSSCSRPGLDVTGTWQGQVTDPEGTRHDIVLTLVAQGTQLAGTVATPPDTALRISNGRISQDRVSFEVAVSGEDGAEKFALTGKVDGNRMEGIARDPRGRHLPFTLTRSGTGPAREAGPADLDQPLAPGPNPHGNDPQPRDAQQAILAAFDTYDVVGGMSASHGNKDTDDFILALVRNPALAEKINDIVVECGNSRYQPILDRYIAGEEVPLAEIRQVWRNTSQPNCGFSAFYEELYPLVRRINQRLPARKRLRILAGDPPIEWSRVQDPTDLRPYQGRDRNIAAVMEKEVLAKRRKALVLFGINHVRHGVNTVGIYEARYPGRTFVIGDYHGFGGYTPLAGYNTLLEKRMAAWPVPSLVTIKGTWLADLGCAYFDPDFDAHSCRGYPGVDALLYLGPRDLLLREPVSAGVVLDQAYMSELRRRAGAVGAPNGPSNPDVTFKRETGCSVFLHDSTVTGRESC